jgi:integrase
MVFVLSTQTQPRWKFTVPQNLPPFFREADDEIRPMITIGGLAGLRTAELLRLDWVDLWRVAGHIEITAGKAKTRQRRLVEICPALTGWLEPFRTDTSGKVWAGAEKTFQDRLNALCASAKCEHKGKSVAVKRKTNGLRHAFCTYHLALNSNDNLTALQAGNSPEIIHAHYKGLATKAEAEKWFNVKPTALCSKMKSFHLKCKWLGPAGRGTKTPTNFHLW